MAFADPPALPHPVRGIGFLANSLEKPLRHFGEKSGRPVLAGALTLCLLCLFAGALVLFCISLPSLFGFFAALYFAFAGLALGSLVREGGKALTAVRDAERDHALLPQARHEVQMLVSRDAGNMDIPALYRSLAESVSENLNDALVAPFFWLCLTGPVGLWVYKTVSTLDSMWGYKNECWRDLGKASARADDVLAYIPARLTVLLMLLTAWLERLPLAFAGLRNKNGGSERGKACFFKVCGWPGLKTIAREAGACASPNAGLPMSAAAWLFQGRSGGPTPYDGEMVEKPLLGPPEGLWTAENCGALIRHAQRLGIVCVIVGLLLI